MNEVTELNATIETWWDLRFNKTEKFFWNAILSILALVGGIMLPDSDIPYLSIAVKAFIVYYTLGIIQVQRNRSINHAGFRKLVSVMKFGYLLLVPIFLIGFTLATPFVISLPVYVTIWQPFFENLQTAFLFFGIALLMTKIFALILGTNLYFLINLLPRFNGRINRLFGQDNPEVVYSKKDFKITEFFQLLVGFMIGIVFIGICNSSFALLKKLFEA